MLRLVQSLLGFRAIAFISNLSSESESESEVESEDDLASEDEEEQLPPEYYLYPRNATPRPISLGFSGYSVYIEAGKHQETRPRRGNIRVTSESSLQDPPTLLGSLSLLGSARALSAILWNVCLGSLIARRPSDATTSKMHRACF
jgi:hypothetical protein